MSYPLPIASVLRHLLKSYGLEGQMQIYILIDQWEKLVGHQIASHTLPYQLKFKRLHLHVDSPAWINQLNYLKEELKRKINKEMGGGWVNEILLRIGPVEKKKETPAEEEPFLTRKEVILSEEEKELIEKCVENVEEKELKEKLKRIFIQGVLYSKKR